MNSFLDTDAESWTVLDVFSRGFLAFECRKCWRLAQWDDLQLLVDKFGPDATLREIGRRSKCARCGSKNTHALVRIRGLRGDRAWRPCPPRASR